MRGSIRILFSAAAIAAAIRAETLPELQQQWRAVNAAPAEATLREVAARLAAFREQPGGKRWEVNYMLGSCWCRIPGQEGNGKIALHRALGDIAIPDKARAMAEAVLSACGQANAKPGEPPVQLITVDIKGAVVHGKGGYPATVRSRPSTTLPPPGTRRTGAARLPTRPRGGGSGGGPAEAERPVRGGRGAAGVHRGCIGRRETRGSRAVPGALPAPAGIPIRNARAGRPDHRVRGARAAGPLVCGAAARRGAAAGHRRLLGLRGPEHCRTRRRLRHSGARTAPPEHPAELQRQPAVARGRVGGGGGGCRAVRGRGFVLPGAGATTCCTNSGTCARRSPACWTRRGPTTRREASREWTG